MTIIWILLAFSCLFYPVCTVVYNRKIKVGDFRPVENKNIKFYFICVSIFMIVIIGLRGILVGRDTLNYFYFYAKHQGISFMMALRADLPEKGYVLFQIIGHKLRLGFPGFNVLYAIVNVGILSYTIYKKSTMPWMSYFLYICLEFFILDMSMVRQRLAMSIVILAVVTDKNKTWLDFLKFFVLIYIASTFHNSAVVAYPIWFLKKISMNNLSIAVTICLIGIAYLARENIAAFLSEYATDVSEKYEMYGKIETGTAGMRLYMMIAVTLALGVFLQRFRKIPENGLPFYCLCMMLIIFPGVQGGGVLMRLYYYYYIFIILYVPNLVTALDPKKDMWIKILIIVLYLAVGIYFLNINLGPGSLAGEEYKFYWQPLE